MEDAGLSLANRSSIPSNAPAAPPRDPITCHVLDLVTGRPASSLAVSLTLLRPYGPSAPFKALTNTDGRIMKWHGQDGPSLQEVLKNLSEHPDDKMVWALNFETGEYYGEGNTFFPEVEIRFFVAPKEEHYHVPLLLGPWSYTTYRGT
jgi:5-hydroxyisourate hydrolase